MSDDEVSLGAEEVAESQRFYEEFDNKLFALMQEQVAKPNSQAEGEVNEAKMVIIGRAMIYAGSAVLGQMARKGTDHEKLAERFIRSFVEPSMGDGLPSQEEFLADPQRQAANITHKCLKPYRTAVSYLPKETKMVIAADMGFGVLKIAVSLFSASLLFNQDQCEELMAACKSVWQSAAKSQLERMEQLAKSSEKS